MPILCACIYRTFTERSTVIVRTPTAWWYFCAPIPYKQADVPRLQELQLLSQHQGYLGIVSPMDSHLPENRRGDTLQLKGRQL